MKKTLLLLTIIFTVFGCTVSEKPIFVKVEKVKVVEATLEQVTVSAEAFFLNPNDLGGTLESKGIDILINDVDVGNVRSETFKVPARNEFSIPLIATIPTKRIFKEEQGGLLGGLLNSILNKTITVQYKGTITYKTLGLSYDYPIDITKEVEIK
ncbi:hypothetical protein ACFQ1M_06590 [Sungkyunkwania multivorans]|uniref:Late embryogenesis abundant protein LEA-2 subgroup domain-containing protein n=1 Tax=Sungkyunkwania multivorans TaxID=1173618 RepID=A0ABW3CVV8_9FLAO